MRLSNQQYYGLSTLRRMRRVVRRASRPLRNIGGVKFRVRVTYKDGYGRDLFKVRKY